jgi:hypothetical protein
MESKSRELSDENIKHQRWCKQCGKLHKTIYKKPKKCEKCKEKNQKELRLKRLFCY